MSETIAEEVVPAAFAELGARHNERLHARLAQMAAEFDRQIDRAADPDQRAEVMAWLRQPNHVPPYREPPTGAVTLAQWESWLLYELDRSIHVAHAMMRAAAEQALAHDCIGALPATAH